MRTVCKNCHQQFKGNYCNNCGQSADTREINLHYLWHAIKHGVFLVDKGIIFTTWGLFTRPGDTIKEYISGRRIINFNPFAYVIILSTIYLLLARLLHVEIFFDKISNSITIEGIEKFKGNETYMNIQNLYYWFKDHFEYSTLILVPVFSLASYLAFRESGYNYLKHFILNTYLAGQRIIVFIIALPIIAMIKNKEVVSQIENIETVIWISLMTWTYIQFFDNNKLFKNILRTLLTYVYLVILLFIILIALGILLAGSVAE